MKKTILKLLLVFATLNVAAQSPNAPSDFVNGIKLSEATQVTTADRIPVINSNNVINGWISLEDLRIKRKDSKNQESQINNYKTLVYFSIGLSLFILIFLMVSSKSKK